MCPAQLDYERGTAVKLVDNPEGLQVGRQTVAGCNPFTIKEATRAFLEERELTDGDVASK